MEKKTVKLKDISNEQFQIEGDVRLWKLVKIRKVEGDCLIEATNEKGEWEAGQWLSIDTEVEIVQELTEEQQAINDIRVSNLCQESDMDPEEYNAMKTHELLLQEWAKKELDKIKLTPEDEKKQFIERMIGIPVPSSFTGTTEEYIQYVERVKKEGLNSDQQDKSPYEEYADTIAERRIVQEYEQWVDKIIEIKNPAQDMLNSPNKGVQYIAGIDPIQIEEGKPAEVYVFRNPPEPGQEYTIDQLNDKNTGEWRSTDKSTAVNQNAPQSYNLLNEPRVKVTTIAHKNNPDEVIAWIIGEQKNLEAKILQWYQKTKDEEYARFMNITTKRQGEI